MIKNLPANARDAGNVDWIPGSGGSPSIGNGNPLQYSCLENSMDRGAWWATVSGGRKELDTIEHAFTYTGTCRRINCCAIPLVSCCLPHCDKAQRRERARELDFLLTQPHASTSCLLFFPCPWFQPPPVI